MNDEMRILLSKPTASILEVGRIVFAMGRKASYRAAANGGFPTIDINGRKRVPTALLAKKLGIEVPA